MIDMTGGVLGGGVIFVVAALLWAAVLVPAWLRRREFRTAERNALRLQRTLRVLAETSEVPHEVRLEATAKEALAHEKLVRTAQRRQEADRQAELAEARAEQLRAELREQRMKQTQAAVQRQAKLRKPIVRRVRAISSLGAVVGVLGALIGAGVAVAGSGFALLVCAGAVFAASLGALVLLAPGRVRSHRAQAAEVEVPVVADVQDTPREVVVESAPSRAAHEAAQRVAAERIQRAKALARARAAQPAGRENQPDSMLLREAEKRKEAQAEAASASVANETEGESTVSSQAPSPARRAPMSAEELEQLAARKRLSQMGVVGDTSVGMPDLDAVLKRRRTG